MISPWRLAKAGILGINCRNHDFISRYNDRRYYPLVDDKLQTRLLAEKMQIGAPRLRQVIRQQHQINHVGELLQTLDSFVLKPAKGSGGKGIWVITGRHGDRFIKASGAEVGLVDIQRHMSNTLAGVYSLAGTADVVLIEDVIQCDERLQRYSHEGVPDIRIIVFQGYPVMAMLRLATHASDGKANLHQGAVGVGLDIASGRFLNAVQYSHLLSRHPDTGMLLKDIVVDGWRDLLVLAARCFEMTRLGYIGADMVVDRQHGPQLLELNARPGLAIQVANGFGLLPRLRHIEKLASERRLQSCEQRVDYVMSAFAASA